MLTESDFQKGARNLLQNCAELKSGDEVFILYEAENMGWYDGKIADAVAEYAKTLNINPLLRKIGAADLQGDSYIKDEIKNHSCIISFARLCDQDRFAEPVKGQKVVMCYTRNVSSLASAFGQLNHHAMVDLKNRLNNILLSARNIQINCPLGTNLTGTISDSNKQYQKDVSVRRFPMGVTMPIDASLFTGKVSLSRYLTSTGSGCYEPSWLKIEHPLLVQIDNGRIIDFTGDQCSVQKAREHYHYVGQFFDIDETIVHSWHAGIHPGCEYPDDVLVNPDRWSNTVFCSPRFLHFHSCGNYAPGEICMMVLDATICVDDLPLWDNGVLKLENFDLTRQWVTVWPETASVFNTPATEICVGV